MSPTLRIAMFLAEALYFILIFFFLKRKTLTLKYTFLWLLAGIVMVVFTAFPMWFVSLIKLCGVESNMNGLFALSVFFIIIILMSLTSIVSKQTEKIRTLTQENALLEERIRKLEEKL